MTDWRLLQPNTDTWTYSPSHLRVRALNTSLRTQGATDEIWSRATLAAHDMVGTATADLESPKDAFVVPFLRVGNDTVEKVVQVNRAQLWLFAARKQFMPPQGVFFGALTAAMQPPLSLWNPARYSRGC